MTEVFATLGPKCADEDILYRMLLEGMSGMRLNLSHTSLEESRELIGHYQNAMDRAGVQAQLLIDLQGGELRIGRFFDGLLLESGSEIELMPEDVQDGSASHSQALARGMMAVNRNGGIPVPRRVLAALDEGDEILLDDGRILLRVERTGGSARTHVIRGGQLTGGKSIKVRDKDIKGDILTRQDMENLRICRDFGVTAIMQPFVTSGEDLRLIRDFLRREGISQPRIFAKIENRQGVEHLDSIIPEADMIVIARGDLGNDVPLWALPAVQKNVSQRCRNAGCPFLVVTQMLSSMIHSPIPTRAEVSDIFNAVADGAAAVMVTNETAVGDYPVEVMRYLHQTVREAEDWREHERRDE